MYDSEKQGKERGGAAEKLSKTENARKASGSQPACRREVSWSEEERAEEYACGCGNCGSII